MFDREVLEGQQLPAVVDDFATAFGYLAPNSAANLSMAASAGA